MQTEEKACTNPDYIVTIRDGNGAVIHRDSFDVLPDEELFSEVIDTESAVFPLKVTIQKKGGKPNVNFRQDNFDSYDNSWLNLPVSGSEETQEAEER